MTQHRRKFVLFSILSLSILIGVGFMLSRGPLRRHHEDLPGRERPGQGGASDAGGGEYHVVRDRYA
jgi:hypothetical protein